MTSIGLAGPITIRPFLPYLDDESQAIGSTLPGLGGTPVTNLGLELLRRGRTLVVFTLDRSVSGDVVLTGPNLRICIGPYRARYRARDAFRVERTYLEQAMRRERPDIVHAHWTYEYALAALSSGVPTLVTAHDAPLNILQYDPSPYRLVRTLMAWSAIRRARWMTAVSPYVATHLRRVFRYRGELHVVNNGLGDEWFDKRPREPASPESASPGRPVTFGCVLEGWGRLKNGQAALKAFSIVRSVYPGTRLVLYGTGHGQGEAAQRWALSRGAASAVTFRGKVPYTELVEELSKDVDILVHPSLEEAFAMVVAEAMALGKPVIAGKRSGGVPYVLGRGGAGLLVDVRQPEEIAAAMIKLASDSAVRRTMGNAARAVAKERYAIAQVADVYEALYGSIAGCQR